MNVVKQVVFVFVRLVFEFVGIQGELIVMVNEQDRFVIVVILVKVVLCFIWFGGMVGYGINLKVVVCVGSLSVICLFVLGDGLVNFGVSNGKVMVNKCNMYFNFKVSDGLVVEGLGIILFKVICMSGGYVGVKNVFDFVFVMDCLVVVDLFVLCMVFSDIKCDFINFKVEIGLQILCLGVYCGGLVIDKLICVWMMYGIYVMKDGLLVLINGVLLNMVDVVVYLMGKDFVFYFDYMLLFDLSVLVFGLFVGIFFFEDCNVLIGCFYQIGSCIVLQLLGMIYFFCG